MIKNKLCFRFTCARVRSVVCAFTGVLLSTSLLHSSLALAENNALNSSKKVVSTKTTVIHSVRGYTFITKSDNSNVDNPQYQWDSFNSIAFKDGKILAVSDGDLSKKFPNAERIDGFGKVMLPGLIDAHGHIIGLGFEQLRLNVRGLTSKAETVKAVSDYARQHGELNWIKGRGWNQELWPSKQFPSSKDLDEFVSDKPVWLTRIDGHAGWANKKALEIAGITKASVDPQGGLIARDDNGEPTGILVDNAMYLLTKKIPKPTDEERNSALDMAQQHLLSLGITSAHDAGISHKDYHLYIDRVKANTLDMRIYGMLASRDPHFDTMLERGYIEDEAEMLSIRSVKISVDGALGSRGAVMIEPYSDRPEKRGLLLWKQQPLQAAFEKVLKAKFQLNVHAIGDQGNRTVLDNFSAAYKTVGGRELRNRIEHAQIVNVNDIKRFVTLDIIPSMQPTHATSDMNMAEDRVGKARLKGAYAWQRFLRQGSRIASGSDFPVELANPFYGIHAAVTRQDRSDQPEGGWISSEAMTVKQAIKSFTIDAAYAAHQDDTLGSIEQGKWADFILLDKDIMNIPTSDLWQVKVLETWVGGERKYKQ